MADRPASVPFANTILILGIGNPFRRDDGIGPAVISRLRSEHSLKGVDLLDGGTDGLALIDVLARYAKVVVVDAVEMGMAAGVVKYFSPAEARLTITTDALSTHGLGLVEVIMLMEKLAMKTEIGIIGIQAHAVTFGEGLSPEVEAKIEEILDLVKEKLGE